MLSYLLYWHSNAPIPENGSVRPNAPTGKDARVGASNASSSPICQPIPLLQQLTRGDPPGGASVREVSAVVAERRRPARRARHRHQPRDGTLLVEPVRSAVC